METDRFAAAAARKTRQASESRLHPFVTEEDQSRQFPVVSIGSDWTRRLFDGPFHLWPDPGPMPAVSLVFVQSKDGNTEADNPGKLGGGPVDLHLIYEGLSRVAADAVLAGAKTPGPGVFFSVWHPELVALRASFGLPRHPAQILLTGSACIDVDALLCCNVPGVPVFILTSPVGCDMLYAAAATRPWIKRVPADNVADHLRKLRADFGISRISCVGGRTTATSLLDEHLVQDVYLTTTAKEGGAPDTPLYAGTQPPVLETIVRKRGTDSEFPIVFEHLAVRTLA